MTPEEKLRWLLSTDLIEDHLARHEVFDLLEHAFPEVSTGLQMEIWDRGQAAYVLEGKTQLYPSPFIIWINQIAPEFAPAAEVIQQFSKDHPEWEAPEHVNFVTWMEVGWVSPEPESLPDGVQTYATLRERELADPSAFAQSNLQDAIAARAAEDPTWGVGVMSDLVDDQAWESIMWRGARYGLERTGLPDTLWPSLLLTVSKHADTREALETASAILLEAMHREPPTLPREQQAAAATALLGLAETLIASGQDETNPGDDALFRALNSWPGRTVQFLTQVAAREEKSGEDPCSAPGLEDFLRLVRDSGASNWAAIATATYGRMFPYLSERCPQLTNATFVPSLVSEHDALALSAWQGLAYARWSRSTVDTLYPYLPQVAARVDQLEARAQEGLVSTLAGIAVTYGRDPTEDGGWLTPFIRGNSPSTRARLLHWIRRNLEGVEGTHRSEVWDAWLRQWWEGRIQGFPRTMEPEEGSMVLGWVFPLRNHLTDVVHLILETPLAERTFGFIHELEKSDLPDAHPTEVVELVAHIVRHRKEFFDHGEVLGVLARSREQGADDNALRRACEAIAQHGVATPDFCNDL